MYESHFTSAGGVVLMGQEYDNLDFDPQPEYSIPTRVTCTIEKSHKNHNRRVARGAMSPDFSGKYFVTTVTVTSI